MALFGNPAHPPAALLAPQHGKIAGNARLELEKKTGRKVVSSDNYLSITGKKEIKKLK